MCDARPVGIAPPTIPLGASLFSVALFAGRPSGGDFFQSEKQGGVVSGGVEHVIYGAAQSVVAGECADGVAHAAAGLSRAQPRFAAVEGEFQQVTAFQSFKHLGPSFAAWVELAQKLVNMPPRLRAMEGVHA